MTRNPYNSKYNCSQAVFYFYTSPTPVRLPQFKGTLVSLIKARFLLDQGSVHWTAPGSVQTWTPPLHSFGQILHFEAKNGFLQQICHQEQAIPTKDLFLLLNSYSNKLSLHIVLVIKCKGSYFKHCAMQISFCMDCISWVLSQNHQQTFTCKIRCTWKKSYTAGFFVMSHTQKHSCLSGSWLELVATSVQ